MKFRRKKKENREKSRLGFQTYALFSIFFFLFSIHTFSQDSIPAAKDLTEEKELNFQQFFFKALSEKAIGNYTKAIQNLENCNQILPDDVAVFFEFSKNYLLLKNTLLAKEYIHRALAKEPTNLWMLKHLVQVNFEEKNLKEAILNQQKLVESDPKERPFLVQLYIYNKEYKKAVSLLTILENEGALSVNLKNLKQRLEKRKENSIVEEKQKDSTNLIAQFKSDKSYKILEQILEKHANNTTVLLKYAEEGIALFPAQPLFYLTKGKVLNNHKKYKKALESLQNGIDFVYEDKMEAAFYNEMAIAYNGLGNTNEEKKYRAKSEKIKN
ncbi:tetratricopeptide repeat protein [Polaribacter sp.]|uniref:tetratricopeptide repeat protein n=1 Tax=Polaribacter sp. TaxID=1920175 RepID=UPI003EF68D12